MIPSAIVGMLVGAGLASQAWFMAGMKHGPAFRLLCGLGVLEGLGLGALFVALLVLAYEGERNG